MIIPTKVLHPETQRHVRRLGTTTNAHVHALDRLIRALDAEGIWDKLHTLHVAGYTSADTLLDLKGNQDSALIGTPSFLAGQGFTTLNNVNLIDTQVVLDSSFSNDLTMSIYIRNSPTVSGHFMGETYKKTISPLSVSTNILRSAGATALYAGIQGSYTWNTITPGAGGFLAASRIDANTLLLAGDEQVFTKISSSTSWGEEHYSILVGTSNYATGPALSWHINQYAHWSIGYGMTATELLAYDNLIKDYFTAWGTAV